MIRAVAAVVLAGLLVQPALATEWLYCGDSTNTVTLGLLLGAADIPSVAGINLSFEDTVWASDVAYGPGEPISLGQAFFGPDRLDADFIGEGGAKLAELRLSHAEEGDTYVYGGTLRIVGRGVWAVSCPGV